MLPMEMIELCGKSMIIDKGLGVMQLQDVLNSSKSHIHFWKSGFGTSCLYEASVLKQKNLLLQANDIITYPGGTLFEAAYFKNMAEHYLHEAKNNAFNGIEISDGTIDLPASARHKYISMAKQHGFTVFSEIGKKTETGFANLIDSVKADLASGADYVILEGRESGTSGLYNQNGIITDSILDVFEQADDLLSKIIWEAPTTAQQIFLLKQFGSSVNLGNIAVHDILSLAALRRGLRSDTFFHFLS